MPEMRVSSRRHQSSRSSDGDDVGAAACAGIAVVAMASRLVRTGDRGMGVAGPALRHIVNGRSQILPQMRRAGWPSPKTMGTDVTSRTKPEGAPLNPKKQTLRAAVRHASDTPHWPTRAR